MHIIKKLILGLCLSLGFPVLHAGEIPLQAFAVLPQIENVQLSPDGLSIAYVQNIKGNSYLITQAPGRKLKAILVNDNKKFYFNNLRWVNNERLLVSTRYYGYRFGNETTETRILAINSDGSGVRADLLQSELDSLHSRKHVPQIQDRILGRVKDDPNSVLVALDLDDATQPDVYRLNVDTAKLSRVVRNPGSIYRWIADRDGEVRAGIGWRNKTIKVIVKAPGTDRWETLSSYTLDDDKDARDKDIRPLGFDADPRFLYINAVHQGRQAVFRVDLSKPEFPRELMHADPRFDVGDDLIYAPWLKKVVGLRYATESEERVYWDETVRRLQQEIDKALPNRTNVIISSSDDGVRHVVISQSPVEAPRVYWLDRKSGQMQLLADLYQELSTARMAPPQPVMFKSRDGIDLHGYLTMPVDARESPAQKKYPLVLFPHGGPRTRDVNGFDYWTQFFVSRGWAVLQVNFRGSSGYGSDFETAGFKRWGLEMQDDLTDGVEWLVKQGSIDPDKVCIVGASYGGYAAMMGAIKTPELYRCAVSIAGVADLRDLLAREQYFIGYEIAAERQIGYLWSDRERLRQTSPLSRAKEIRTPLLLVHGKEDRVVVVDQSRDMAGALKSAGNADFRYVELPLGDHYLTREEDRIKTFSEMEQFLKKYLD